MHISLSGIREFNKSYSSFQLQYTSAASSRFHVHWTYVQSTGLLVHCSSRFHDIGRMAFTVSEAETYSELAYIGTQSYRFLLMIWIQAQKSKFQIT